MEKEEVSSNEQKFSAEIAKRRLDEESGCERRQSFKVIDEDNVDSGILISAE